MIIKNVNLETVCGITSAIPDNLLDEVGKLHCADVYFRLAD